MRDAHESTPLPEQLQYTWPPNLTTYEARLWLGFTAQQWLLTAMAGMVPMTLIRSGVGLVLGMVLALTVLLAVKPIGRFGGISLPMYVAVRLWHLVQRKTETIELPLIVGGNSSTVELEDWEGATLLIMEED